MPILNGDAVIKKRKPTFYINFNSDNDAPSQKM